MAATSFCTAHFSWVAKEPVNTIRYSFIDLNSETDEENSLQRLNNDDASPILHLIRKDDSPDCCVQISCCDPSSAQINGISVLSESRTLELSNNTEGYISTVRGKKSRIDDDGEGEGQTQFYRCSYVFSHPQTKFQVKFMSLGNRSMFHLQSLVINLEQQLGVHPRKPSNMFDMDKLKSDIEGMGDTVSEKALDFLKTMELYEQNKSKTLGNWLDHIDQENGPMVTSSQPSPNEPVPSSNNMLSQGLSSIMESVLGEDTVLSLAKARPRNGGQANGNIFSMLQAVCGEVTKMRTPPPTPKVLSEEADTQNQQLPDSTSSESDKNGTKHMVLNAEILDKVERRLEDAKGEMRREIKLAKEEVMTKLHEINQEMDTKLNLILHLLQENHKKENGDSVSESVTQAISESIADDMDR